MRVGTAPSPAPSAARWAPPLGAVGPAAPPPAVCGGGGRDPRARTPGCTRQAREAGRAPPPPPAAGGRGRARREPAGECAGRELRARGRSGARRGAGLRSPATRPLPLVAAGTSMGSDSSPEPWLAACAESLIMKGKVALSPPYSEAGSFCLGRNANGHIPHLPARKKWERGLERL